MRFLNEAAAFMVTSYCTLPADHPRRAEGELHEARLRCTNPHCKLPTVRFIHEGEPLDPCRFCGWTGWERA